MPHPFLQTDVGYTDLLLRKITDAVQLAWQRRVPATLRAGSGQVEGIAGNRRWWMRDGTLRTNPRFQDPDLDRPAGPIDPQVGIVAAGSCRWCSLAILSNYALHSDEVGGTALGGDHQGAEAAMLKRVLGRDCVVLCSNGCCGDINHYDWSKPAPQSGQWRADRSGTVLAGEVTKQLPDLAPVDTAKLTAASADICADLRVPSEDEIAWAKKVVGGEMHGFDAQGLAVVKAYRMLEVQDMHTSQRPLEVSVITVGDVAFVGLPGEVFVELGLDIKERSPFAITIVSELCNDSAGYVPTAKAYGEGGYEATSTPFAEGTGERLVEEALELLRAAKEGE